MKHVALHEDLKTLLAAPGLNDAARALLQPAYFAQQPDSEALCEIALTAELEVFRALALMLKADWESYDRKRAEHEREHQEHELRYREFIELPTSQHVASPEALAAEPWRPWSELERWSASLAQFEGCPTAELLEILLLEQWWLGCQHLAMPAVVPLAARHQCSIAILQAASAAEQHQFLTDKGEWLRQEFEHECLSWVRAELSDEIERTRFEFLSIFHDAYTAMVEAAHRTAAWKYRERYGDITMTNEEISERLKLDLGQTGDPLVPLDPELRAVLRDCAESVRADLASIHYLAGLVHAGKVTPASREEIEQAKRLFHKLARLIHPDALSRHPQYESISEENAKTLEDIYVAAAPVHRMREYLERKRLLNHLQHLQEWTAQAKQILRHLDFHDPARIVEGDTLQAQWDYVRKALRDVHEHLHAMRDELARLQADPLHREWRRILALPQRKQRAERSRMRRQAKAWHQEADEIERRMSARSVADSAADREVLKGARP